MSSSDQNTFITANAVDVHPTVLLSVVDHYTRINSRAATERRVVGLLMGSYIKKKDDTITLDINNCFAVPFDEDVRDPEVWFLDTNFAEDMFKMQRKVMPKAHVVGWYSSGPTICHNDTLLHAVVADRFCPNPVYCVVNTDTTKSGIPVLAYTAAPGRGANNALEFRNIPTDLATTEPEEIGVEQLLRDLTDSTVTTLTTQIQEKHQSLAHLELLLKSISEYLGDVAAGKLPLSQEILGMVQELTGYQPQVHRLQASESMVVTLNDEALATFVASLSRTVMSLYNVIINRRNVAKETAKLVELKEKARAKKAEEEEKKAKEAAAATKS